MPYYSVVVKEKGRGSKTTILPESVFAPCVSEAWDEASRLKLPKKIVIVDVIPQSVKYKKHQED